MKAASAGNLLHMLYYLKIRGYFFEANKVSCN